MTISRAMMRRQLRSQGGIMQLETRQPFIFGGIVKSVKKAVKGVAGGIKDLISSDVGKMALLAAGTYKLGGGNFGALFKGGPTGFSFQNLPGAGLFAKGAPNIVDEVALTGGGLNIGKAFKTGASILGGSALISSLFGSPQAAQEAYQRNPGMVKQYIKQYYKNINPDASDEEVETFATSQLGEYAAKQDLANGGRVGFEEGGTFLTMEEAAERDPAMFMDTTTYNPIPADADRQGAAGIAKIMMGISDLPRDEDEIEDDTISSTEYMYNEYLIPKRKELMENFGLTMEEADNLIREEMLKLKTKTVERDKKGLGGLITKMINNNPEIFKKLQMSSPVKQLQARYMMNLNPKMEEEEVMDYIRENAAYGGPMGEPRENQQGIKELDYRKEGGFVPVGIKEKADDVPAMLSKNEFVMTADAVRGAGNGDVEKGAQRMYKVMKTLENGGRI
jgi:hypothetical protein